MSVSVKNKRLVYYVFHLLVLWMMKTENKTETLSKELFILGFK